MQWWTLKQLKSSSAKARLAAAQKLGEEGAEALVQPLAPLLSDPDAAVRTAIAGALGRIRSEAAAGPLVNALRTESQPEVRCAVIKALQDLQSVAAIPSIVEALGDPSGEVCWQAAQALKTLRWEPLDPDQAAALHLANNQFDAAVALGAAAIPPLIRVAQGLSFHRSIRAIEALAKIGGAQAVKPILDCLQSNDFTVRSAAATALGELGDARALDPLIAVLRDPHHQVCLAACVSLGKLADERAVEPVLTLLSHNAPDVRTAAVETLGKLRAPAALPALLERLADPDNDVRAAAATVLGGLGDEAAIEKLVVALADAQTTVRQAAAAALGRIQACWERTENALRAIPALQAALKSNEYWVRHSAAEILRRLGLAGEKETPLVTDSDGALKKRLVAQDLLFAMLTDPDRIFRQAAAEAIGRMGLSDSQANLVERLSDPDRGVKRAAARALELLRWQSDHRPDKARQLVALERWTAAAALGDAAVDALVEALSWNDPLARRSATETLLQIGSARAHASLEEFATNAPEAIREEAAAGLAALHSPAPSLSLAQR